MKQRMRRISALLLVVLMCVSMVVPAFAADGAECPEVHTKSNCTYTQIGEPHPAGCGEQGFTTYQCNDCGAYFADDFVEAVGEDHAWQVVIEYPTCVKDGYMKMVCLNCGKEEVEDATENEDLEAYGHEWELVGDTCEDGLVCSECGETAEASEVEDDVHAWGDPVLVDGKTPTHNEKGEVVTGAATVTCELCGLEKTVDVYCSGEHVWDYDEKKDPTCEETGTHAGAKCLICGKVVVGVDEDGNGIEYDSEKHEHAPFEEIETVTCDISVEWVVELPTCTAAGQAYKVCTMCNEMVGKPVVLDPVGHNYQTKVYVEVETNGMTADQIGMFNALAAGKSNVDDYAYSILVKNADGTYKTVTGTCDVPAVLAKDAEATPMTVTSDGTATNETYYVWTGEYQNDDPTAVDKDGEQQWMHWATSCNSATETHFYTYVCTTCEHSEPTVKISGHYWVESGRVAPDCKNDVDGSITYACANPWCDGKNDKDGDDVTVVNGDVVKTVVLEAAHNYETKVTAPTCETKGYTQDICTYCNTPDESKADEGQTEGKYDVVDADESKHTPVDTVKKAATCTEDGWKIVTCSTCGDLLEEKVVIKATGHDLDYTTVVKKTNADCTAPGYNYYACKTCGELVPETHTAQKSHSYTKAVVVGVDCTKGVGGYTVYYCTTCNEPNPENVEGDPVTFDPDNMEHHGNVVVEDIYAGDCVTPDKVYYTCNKCELNKVWAVDVEDYNESGNGKGHTFTKVDAVKPTCSTAGNVEYYVCDDCGYMTLSKDDTMGEKEDSITLADTVLKALSEDGECDPDKRVYIDALEATCTTDGHTAGYECSVCGTLTGATKISKLNHTYAEGTTDGEGNDLSGKDAWFSIDSREQSCTEWGYNYLQCGVCGEEKIVDYVADLGGHKEEEVKGYDATCSTVGKTDGKVCTECGEVTVAQEEIAKLAHKNKAGDEFYGICTETLEDRKCVTCGADYTGLKEDILKTDKYGNPVYDSFTGELVVLEKDTVGGHEWIYTEVPATCMAYSYTLVVCKHCEYDYMTDEGFAYSEDHLYWGDWKVTTEATALEAGEKTRECACGAVETEVIPALAELEFELEVDNAIVAGAEIVNGGYVSITVKTNASDLDVWGLRITLDVDDDLTYVASKSGANKNSKFESIEYTQNTDGTIVIIATAPTGADGKIANVVLDGEEALVTLVFQVDKDANVGDSFVVGAGSVYEVVDEDRNYIDMTAPEAVTVTVDAKLLDAVRDGEWHVDDLKALKAYITGEAEEDYDAACDADFDGEITADDYAALLTILKTGKVSD